MARYTVGNPCGEWTVWDSVNTICVARSHAALVEV